MGMPAGIKKSINYYNKIEAWLDWHRLAKQLQDAGMDALVEKYQPKPDAGWRTIDKQRHKLEAELGIER